AQMLPPRSSLRRPPPLRAGGLKSMITPLGTGCSLGANIQRRHRRKIVEILKRGRIEFEGMREVNRERDSQLKAGSQENGSAHQRLAESQRSRRPVPKNPTERRRRSPRCNRG